MAIKAWAEDDRPREKLINKGSAQLSDAELLAIFIGSGSIKDTALDLAKKILQSCDNNLMELQRFTASDLMAFSGVGLAKTAHILAAIELGRRMRSAKAKVKAQVKSSQDAFQHLEPILAHKDYEEFWVLYLNNHNRLLALKQISKGGLTGTLADIRTVFKIALELKSTALILAHNHPSGSLNPSSADQQLTRKMSESGQLIDIAVLDHLIVTEGGYFSFSDEGMI